MNRFISALPVLWACAGTPDPLEPTPAGEPLQVITALPQTSAEVTVSQMGAELQLPLIDMKAELPLGALDYVMVSAPGHATQVVIEPGAGSLKLNLYAEERIGRMTGFRGSINMANVREGNSIMVGIVGRLMTMRKPDFGVAQTFFRVVPSFVEVPELGLERQESQLPGNTILGFGNRSVMDDHEEPTPQRCLSGPVPNGHLGCFSVRTPSGPTPLWAIADRTTNEDAQRLVDGLDSIKPLNPNATQGRLLNLWFSTMTQGLYGASAPLSPGAGAQRSDFADVTLNVETEISQTTVIQLAPAQIGGICADWVAVFVGSGHAFDGFLPTGMGNVSVGSDRCLLRSLEEAIETRARPPAGRVRLRHAPADRIAVVAKGPGGVSMYTGPKDEPVPQWSQPTEVRLDTANGALRNESPQTNRHALFVDIITSEGEWQIFAPADRARVDLPAPVRALDVSSATVTASIFELDRAYAEAFADTLQVRSAVLPPCALEGVCVEQ